MMMINKCNFLGWGGSSLGKGGYHGWGGGSSLLYPEGGGGGNRRWCSCQCEYCRGREKLEYKIYKIKSHYMVWFKIEEDINKLYLTKVYNTLEVIEELPKARVYFSMMAFENSFWSIGKTFMYPGCGSKEGSIKYVNHVIDALSKLENKAYPIDQGEYFIVKVMGVSSDSGGVSLNGPPGVVGDKVGGIVQERGGVIAMGKGLSSEEKGIYHSNDKRFKK